MKKLLIVLFFVVANTNLFGHILIDQYVGTWQGKMIIYSNGLVVDTSVQVIFEIDKIENSESYVWKKTYTSSRYPEVIKDYKLVYKGDNKFEIDEGDGIVLTSYLFEQKLFSSFTMKKTLISSIYTFNKDEILFELISGNRQKKIKEGIHNYELSVLQHIKFVKIK